MKKANIQKLEAIFWELSHQWRLRVKPEGEHGSIVIERASDDIEEQLMAMASVLFDDDARVTACTVCGGIFDKLPSTFGPSTLRDHVNDRAREDMLCSDACHTLACNDFWHGGKR